MVILDSSIIVAYFRNNEIDHARAKKIFREHQTLFIPNFVLSEVLTVLKMKEGFEAAAGAIEFLVNSDDIEIVYINEDMFDSSIGYFVANKNSLSFVDTLLLKLANSEKIPLLTFDRELERAIRKS